jgi:hypothetical protein
MCAGIAFRPRFFGVLLGGILIASNCFAAQKPKPEDHWSFQPLSSPSVPNLKSEISNPIDAFLRQKLNAAGLKQSPRADRRTLIRRLYFDLHGLPPTLEQIRAFKTSSDPLAWETLIDETLTSPRYGERWAQRWLDIVRYADTHGYEVNTPRENAWPFRDYVIRAFNQDKPYDRFVYEQLAGDTVGEDAATGFLVAAAVLLPGQIGKDDASKRLARHDSLDEMIVATGETFLGLSVGCARCHDHKFDPISQKDYYGMQAFFAGVAYGDRKMHTPEYEARLQAAKTLEPEFSALRAKANAIEPPAFAGRTILLDDEDLDRVSLLKEKRGHGANPAGTKRGYKDDKGDSQRLPNLSKSRYTWWTNKPGEDVFTYNPKVAGQFRVWLSWGAHGSGVHTRDARYILDLDGNLETRSDQKQIAKIDQYYPAGVTEGETENKPLWSGFHDAGEHTLRETSRIIIRGGETKTGVTADVILLQESAGNVPAHRAPRLREPVNAQRNVEKFSPTKAKFIRFTSLATIDADKHEPCIDELEIFSAGKTPKNIALASAGSKATSSGNRSNTGKHQLKHINDGLYGNSQSWISNEKGRGWVQLELPEPTLIDRIIWGRDRDSKFKDRLPVRYRIEVATEPDKWTIVARSDDRAPMETPTDRLNFKFRNLAGEEHAAANGIFKRLNALEAQVSKLKKPDMVYAGIFRKPDETRLLARGDSEQPKQIIAPRSLTALKPIELKPDSPDRDRRISLANWIASADHPLTARVMVNRLWQYHFGVGLVATPSDFGMNGVKPSHPELLDWLAGEFIRSGWSIKHIHKLILTSEAFQQSSRIDPAAQTIDADCRLLWRFPSRRLEAEAIRDSLLAASGALNLSMGGPGYSFFKTRGGLSGFPPIKKFGPKELRRMIYSHKIRMESVPVFGAFDCPDAGQPQPKRSESTTAIQALNLFNSPFVLEESARLANRVKKEAGESPEAQIRRAFEIVLGRQPSEKETQASLAAAKQHGLATLCRALFNSSEFLFLP